jgi:hypothetical protein
MITGESFTLPRFDILIVISNTCSVIALSISLNFG